MDIQVIIIHFPSCQTWRDIANLCRVNLNPRTIQGTTTPPRSFSIIEYIDDFQNVVLASEIVAFFKLAGLSPEEAVKAAQTLVDLGHFRIVGYTSNEPRQPIIYMGPVQR